MRYSTLTTPIGELLLTADDDGALTAVDLPNRHRDTAGLERDDEHLAAARRQLTEYFAGERTTFDLPLAPAGTPFQVRVWDLLRRIPYGETASYGELAEELGQGGRDHRLARAVGAANGRNPLAIVVPCHRVIGADGTLTGYAGGLECKRALLDLEVGRATLV
ncbi:MAG: methylated-DNA-[protein]-cysteine S-methyltransferase [Solirubrobacteraceae bacterium]|jgi:methylated-DNA-[protein]-cysteine S-methyltransferase|nr:methylated-DNA-[protein]-cysteine S-methyltransferase [Solirubrobacteraceae bacterium]